jgi:hypothetical protein
MRIFKKEGSGSVWKLLQITKDLEINDITSINWGPGKTKQDLYRVLDINDLTIINNVKELVKELSANVNPTASVQEPAV